MSQFYIITFLVFAAWKTLSLTLHFFSASPWGGALVAQPDRLLPDALLIEWGLLGVSCLAASGVDAILKPARWKQAWRGLFLASACLYCVFSQVDQEVVRWLGQHMTLSYLRNYAGVPDGTMTARIFGDDVFWTATALFLIMLTPATAIAAWHTQGRRSDYATRRTIAIFVTFVLLAVSANQWFRPSEKRWRRIRPAALSIAQDGFISLSGQEKPRDSDQATADLVAFVVNGDILTPAPLPSPATYPLWRNTNLGELSPEAFKALPPEERPDIIFVVFETLRAWNTGLVPHPSLKEGSPQLNRILNEEAVYFPYTHSAGFPSVEGCMGMHLGIWPHFRKIVFSDYTHVRSKALPEILRDFGYTTHALLGADPSFSNFTSWFNRWYDAWEYDPDNHHDGPLVDRFIERYDAYEGTDPRFWLMWTATTHPPYDLPTSEGIPPADDNEARFDQAIRYSEAHIVRLIDHLKSSPNWERTIVVIVGDHAQPTPEQWKMPDAIGHLTPGHTWTVLSMLGGWKGLPPAQRYDFDVSHVDIAPTLLGMLNIKAYNHFMGQDLRDKIALEDGTEPPVLAFRQGDVAWLDGTQRLQFRLDSPYTHLMEFGRDNPLDYGNLPGGTWSTRTEAPASWPVERWRDMIRLHGTLLDEDRLMPPSVGRVL